MQWSGVHKEVSTLSLRLVSGYFVVQANRAATCMGVVSGETCMEKMALLSPISCDATNVLESLLTR